MDKATDSAVLSLRLQDAALAELTERAQCAGKTRSRFARELIMKALSVSSPVRTVFRTVDEEELIKPHALKLLLKESENEALMRIAAAQGVSRQQLVIGLIRMVAASEPQFTKDETQALYAATWELRKIGVNINQIARRLNEEAKAGRLRGTEAAQFLKLSTALTNRMEHVVGKVGDLIKASRARCKLVEIVREDQP